LFGTDLLMQLDVNDPLLKLAGAIPWQEFDEALSIHYMKSFMKQKIDLVSSSILETRPLKFSLTKLL